MDELGWDAKKETLAQLLENLSTATHELDAVLNDPSDNPFYEENKVWKPSELIYEHDYDTGSSVSDGNNTTHSGKSGTVICTELYRQGLMDKNTYLADSEFGKHLQNKNSDIIKGYHLWAKPVVKLMQRYKLFTKVICAFAIPWAEEMAYQMKAREKGNLFGKILMGFGIPFCIVINEVNSNRYIFLIILFSIGIILFYRRKKIIKKNFSNKPDIEILKS